MERFLKFLSELFPTPADASFWWDNVGKQNNDTANINSSSSSSSDNSPAVAEAITLLDDGEPEYDYDDDNDFEQGIGEQLHDDQEAAESSLPSQEEDDDVDGDEQVVVSRWRCYLCNLTEASTSRETLNSHLRGKRHRINLANQLTKKERMVRVVDGRFADGGDAGTVLVRRTGAATWQCIVCDVSCSGKPSMVDHLLGKKHSAVVRNHHGHPDACMFR